MRHSRYFHKCLQIITWSYDNSMAPMEICVSNWASGSIKQKVEISIFGIIEAFFTAVNNPLSTTFLRRNISSNSKPWWFQQLHNKNDDWKK